MHATERWILGVTMALLNCVLSSLGFTLQRKSYLLSVSAQEQTRNDSDTGAVERKPRPAIRGLWIIGVFLYIVSAVPDVVAYALVPMVVCTTVACFRLVVVTCLAHFFLHERVRRREFLGMMACTIGTFLCLTFGPRPPAKHRIVAVDEIYHPVVVPYVVVGFGLLLFLSMIEYSDSCGCAPLSERLHFTILPVITGLAFGLEKVFNTEIGFLESPKHIPQDLIGYPIWAAMALLIGILGITDFCFNMRGAQRMPVQIFMPAAFAFGTALQYLQSVFIFGELRSMPIHKIVLSVCGCVASLIGAVCIQPPALENHDNRGGHKLIQPIDSSLDDLESS